MIRELIIARLGIVVLANAGGVVLAEQDMALLAGSTWMVAYAGLLLST